MESVILVDLFDRHIELLDELVNQDLFLADFLGRGVDALNIGTEDNTAVHVHLLEVLQLLRGYLVALRGQVDGLQLLIVETGQHGVAVPQGGHHFAPGVLAVVGHRAPAPHRVP